MIPRDAWLFGIMHREKREEKAMYAGGLNFALGEEIEALRDSVRRFAGERIAPLAAEIDRNNSFPDASLAGDWAISACSASPPMRTMAAPAWAISPIASPWRRSAAPRPPLA